MVEASGWFCRGSSGRLSALGWKTCGGRRCSLEIIKGCVYFYRPFAWCCVRSGDLTTRLVWCAGMGKIGRAGTHWCAHTLGRRAGRSSVDIRLPGHWKLVPGRSKRHRPPRMPVLLLHMYRPWLISSSTTHISVPDQPRETRTGG
jgi:hypothetical protein